MGENASYPPLGIEDLLQEERWLTGVVRRLVGPDDADDVLQDTWLAALRRPPREPGAVRSWLLQVARNFAIGHQRARVRRRAGEEAAARADRVPSTQETVERLATYEVLVRAIVDLNEPYRTAVLLRHYHGHTVAEAARRRSWPPGSGW